MDDLNALGFNMDDYDDEARVDTSYFFLNFNMLNSWKPDDVAANIGSLIIPTSQNEYEFGDGDDEEEAVDVTLKADDHVLLAGNDCPDGTANVEVRNVLIIPAFCQSFFVIMVLISRIESTSSNRSSGPKGVLVFICEFSMENVRSLKSYFWQCL